MIFFILIPLLTPGIVAARDEFHEELLVKPLASGHILTHFQFTTLWNTHSKSFQPHYHIFPRIVGSLVRSTNIQELHFTISQGIWRNEQWGYPINAAPSGAQIWAWFHDDTPDVSQSWNQLTEAISGIFCASTSINHAIMTTQPGLSFRPMGVSQNADTLNSSYVRYASLPREYVCTENLTPWKKLLPCSSAAGLASLLSGTHIFNSNYHLLQLSLRSVCVDPSCTLTALELSQSVTVVFDVVKQSASFNWSFRDLFGVTMLKQCIVAKSSKIYIDSTLLAEYQCELSPKPNDKYYGRLQAKDSMLDKETDYHVYTLSEGAFDRVIVLSKCAKPFKRSFLAPPMLDAHQYLTGYGQERGGIRCDITNNGHVTMPIVYMLTTPWYIRLYLHTLSITNYRGEPIKPLYRNYIPAKERSRPYHLEVLIKVPQHSTIHLSIQFDLALLRWTEYPPDASHGFYVPSSIISFHISLPSNMTALQYRQESSLLSNRLSSSSPPHFIRIYTESLLVRLMTPDFSMPYNVICLTCTVVAIIFGSIHNMTTRRLILYDPKKAKKTFLTKLKERVLLIFKKGVAKVEVKESETNADEETVENKSE